LIPFNYLGWAFKLFGKGIYPDWVFEALYRLVKNLNEDDIFLDIGAGTGVLTEYVYTKNYKPTYIAVDPAYGMIKHVKNPVIKIVAKAENLPFASDIFSVITLGETLHHIQDLNKGFKEIYRVLKKGGYLFIFDFDPTEKKGKLIYNFEKLFGEPVNFFRPEELAQFLNQFNFKSEYVKYGYRYILIARKLS